MDAIKNTDAEYYQRELVIFYYRRGDRYYFRNDNIKYSFTVTGGMGKIKKGTHLIIGFETNKNEIK
jgi:hypothetical protein